MAEELSDLGIEHVGSGPDTSPISADPTELLAISKTMATNVQAVLLGYDVHFSYTKQFKAASYLLNKVGIFTGNYRQIQLPNSGFPPIGEIRENSSFSWNNKSGNPVIRE